MTRSVQDPALGGRGAVWEICGLPVLLGMCAVLCACETSSRTLNFEPPAAESWMTTSGDTVDSALNHAGGSSGGLTAFSGKTEILLPGTPNSYDLPKPITTLAMQGCSIKDRFDRKTTLAWKFNDDQSKLDFKLSVKGPDFGDPTRLEFKGAELRFTYKLQKYKTPKEKCLYSSQFQGLVGSLYNEFVERESDTVVQELRAKGLDF